LAGEVERFESLDAVARAAAGALDRAAEPLLFHRLPWFHLVARHCPPRGRLLALRSGDTWLFLAVEARKARAYGCWYSLRTGLSGGRDGALAIATELRKHLATLDISPIEDPAALADALRAAGWIVRLSPATASWRADTAGKSFADYWAERPSRLRATAARKSRTAGLAIDIHRRFDLDAWAAYEAVYRASWKPAEGSFVFLRAMAEEEGAAGTLRLGVARKDGEPVAAQLWTVENGTAWIHKLAYREDAKSLSPGTVLGEAMFRAAIDEDGVARIDYGTGDEPYKADWMDRRETLWRVEAFNPRMAAGLAGAARAGASALVRRLRSG
jgi:hypothetical protein